MPRPKLNPSERYRWVFNMFSSVTVPPDPQKACERLIEQYFGPFYPEGIKYEFTETTLDEYNFQELADNQQVFGFRGRKFTRLDKETAWYRDKEDLLRKYKALMFVEVSNSPNTPLSIQVRCVLGN